MGNALIRCLEGAADDHAGGGDRYPYYHPTSGLPDIGLQAGATDALPPTYLRVLAHHGFTAAAALDEQFIFHGRPSHRDDVAVAEMDRQSNIDFKPTPLPSSPEAVIFQSGRGGLSSRAFHQLQRKTCQDQQDIDETSAAGLCDAVSYTKSHQMLIQVPVLGTSKKFWRLSDDAIRISRKLALILWSHHAAGKYLAAPLHLSSVRIGRSSFWSVGSVKLRGVQFSGNRFSQEHVRNDYRDLARVLQQLISVSGGDVNKLPPDYKEFLALLASDAVTMEDEFLIVNHPALLPMSNRTDVFLTLYDRIVTTLDRTPAGRNKKNRILTKLLLPYRKCWLNTANSNTEIKKYVDADQVKKNPYNNENGDFDLLRLNRNVRSHLHQHNHRNNVNMEEVLYYEWPLLLTEMARLLHEEGELQSTEIHNKFGC